MILLVQSNMVLELKDKIARLSADLVGLAPEVILVITAVLVLLFDLFFKKKKGVGIAAIAFAGFAFTLFLLITGFKGGAPSQSLMNNLIRLDQGAVFFKILIALGGLLALILMQRSAYKNKFFRSSEPLLMLLGLVLGAFLMTMANNLLMVYISIEVVSISSYLLTGMFKGRRNTEAAVKYLLFGAVASAVMLYGISWLYGFTGTLDYTSIQFADGISKVAVLPLSLALIMTLGGFLFKLGAFPFHIWSPDVYEASPLPVVAVFSTLPKLAALTLIFRFVRPLDPNLLDWQLWLGVIAIASMTAGNFSALWQKNVKRMLAYSSIAHAGFLLVGVLAYSISGEKAVMFYAVVYLFMNFAAFFVIQVFEKNKESSSLDSFRGMGQKLPYFGVLMLIVMISLTGLPPTAGFNAKLFIFSALWESWQNQPSSILLWVFVFGLLNTVVALFYYLKVPFFMFFKKPMEETGLVERHYTDKIWGTILTIPLLLWFFKSDWLLDILNSVNFVF